MKLARSIYFSVFFCTCGNIYKIDANGEVASFIWSIYSVHINGSHTQPFLCLKTFPGQITSGNWRSWELDSPNVVHIHHSWKFSVPKTLYYSFLEAIFSNFEREIRYAISKLDHSQKYIRNNSDWYDSADQSISALSAKLNVPFIQLPSKQCYGKAFRYSFNLHHKY